MVKPIFISLLLILAGAFVLLLILGRKSVRTEIDIEAPPSLVWQVLTNTSEAKSWNAVLIPVKGELVEGGRLIYSFRQEEGGETVQMDASVKSMRKNELINQTGGLPLVLSFNHSFVLKEIPQGTKVIIHEKYRGIMVPFWNPAPVEKAYARLLNSLKHRVLELNE